MEKEKTHYRAAFDSPYLSSADIVEPTVLTIKNVELLPDKTKRTKDKFNTAFFTEKELRKGEELKPMILNAHNSRVIKTLTGSPFIDDWNNVDVTIYVDDKVRFGASTVEGLRISTEKPRRQKPELTKGTEAWTRAIAAYKRDKGFSAIEKHMTVSDEAKDAIKKEAGNVG
jgi:hypothetical protein